MSQTHPDWVTNPWVWLAGTACAAVLQKPALSSRLYFGYSQQKFTCLTGGKYQLRTSTKMKVCLKGAGLKLIFLLTTLWKQLNVRQQQRDVLRSVDFGCRHVNNLHGQSSRLLYLHSPSPRHCLWKKKTCRPRFTANNITSTTHQMIEDNWNVATNKDYNYY